MRLHTSLATAGIAVALSVTLAGCFPMLPFNPTESPSTPVEGESALPAISAEPATGELIAGTGYSVNAPEGWAVPSDASPRADIFAAAEEADAVGFIDNVNVLLGSGTGETLAEIEVNGVAYLEEVVEATDVQLRPRVAVAGIESLHFSALLSRSGINYWVEQYLVIDGATVYTVTFSFSETVSQDDREALAESVLVTWAWA